MPFDCTLYKSFSSELRDRKEEEEEEAQTGSHRPRYHSKRHESASFSSTGLKWNQTKLHFEDSKSCQVLEKSYLSFQMDHQGPLSSSSVQYRDE